MLAGDAGASQNEAPADVGKARWQGPARERASSRHTDHSGVLISLVVKQGYEIVARLSALEGWQVVERLEQRPLKRHQKDHPGHAALRLSIP